MIFMYSILLAALPHGSEIYLITVLISVLISGLVMISLYIIIIIIICVVGMGKKDKIMRRNNKN